MNWVQIFLFSAKHQNFDAFSWGQMHFLKVQWASRVTWLGFISEGKALSIKKLGTRHWAKQNGHNNYQFLVLTLLFLEFELELIRLLSVFMSPCNSYSGTEEKVLKCLKRNHSFPSILGSVFPCLDLRVKHATAVQQQGLMAWTGAGPSS